MCRMRMRASPALLRRFDFEIKNAPADGTKAANYENWDFGTSPCCKRPSVEQICMTVGGPYRFGRVAAMTKELAILSLTSRN